MERKIQRCTRYILTFSLKVKMFPRFDRVRSILHTFLSVIVKMYFEITRSQAGKPCSLECSLKPMSFHGALSFPTGVIFVRSIQHAATLTIVSDTHLRCKSWTLLSSFDVLLCYADEVHNVDFWKCKILVFSVCLCSI